MTDRHRVATSSRNLSNTIASDESNVGCDLKALNKANKPTPAPVGGEVRQKEQEEKEELK